MRRLRLFAAAAVVALGCSGDDGPTEQNTTATVSVQNNSFTPGTVSVPVNGSVTWVWNSDGVAHNVTFESDGPTSGDLTSGSYPLTFNTAGSFPYACTIHGAQGMVGVVTVTSGTGGGGTGGGGDGGYP